MVLDTLQSGPRDEGLGLTPPKEVMSFTEDRRISRTVGNEVRDALQAHVVSRPNNVYTPTDSPETLNIDGQKITLNVRNRKIKVGEKEHAVAETIVEPKDPSSIRETHIILGGYSVNTPHYYQNFIPFTVTGVRFVFINLLGGGTEEYENKPKRISLLGGETSVDDDYLPQAAAQISSLIAEFNDTPVTLEGYSMGGLIVAKSLARPDLLDGQHVKRINRVTLDAPVPTGALPFGVGSHLIKLVGTSVRHGFAGAFGMADAMSKDFLAAAMMPDLKRTAEEGDEHNSFGQKARRLIKEVSAACFSATGVFPEMAFSINRDPLVKMAKDEKARDHRDLISRIPITVVYRPGDKVIPAQKLQKMIERWIASGYDARAIESRHFPNSHMDLSGLEHGGTWLNGHGQAGRLSPETTNLVPNTRRASRSQGRLTQAI